MSRAVCDACKGWLYWHAGRGCRLADVSCPICGGKLRAFKAGRLLEELDERGFRIHELSPDEKLTLNLNTRKVEQPAAFV